jgi:predicted dithiol-disulfide oxidoreductase (DUF899 family)
MDRPNVVSKAEGLVAREALLTKEKALTRQRDALRTERRGLPMVKLEKDYVFEGTVSPVALRDLFGPHRQLTRTRPISAASICSPTRTTTST